MTAPAHRVRFGALSALVAGRGSPVLLLHGIGGAAASFAPQLAGELTTRHRLVAWDAPGYGCSDDPSPQEPTPDPSPDHTGPDHTGPGHTGLDHAGLDHTALDQLADAARGVLDAIGCPAHVVGVSWGGVIATRLALRHPDAVRGLVLADSTRGSGRTEAGRRGMAHRVEELAALGPRAFAALRAPRLLAPGAPRQVADRVRDLMSGVGLPGYTLAAASMRATDHTHDLRGIGAPTLVVVGEHDVVTGVAESRAIADAVPGARLAVIAGAGHAANQERPRAFDATVGEFLAEVEHPAAERPAVEHPVAERPDVERPVVEHPAVERSAVERRAAESPTGGSSGAGKPSADDLAGASS